MSGGKCQFKKKFLVYCRCCILIIPFYINISIFSVFPLCLLKPSSLKVLFNALSSADIMVSLSLPPYSPLSLSSPPPPPPLMKIFRTCCSQLSTKRKKGNSADVPAMQLVIHSCFNHKNILEQTNKNEQKEMTTYHYP